MAGGMFAGHDESGGKDHIDEKTGKRFKQFYGMSSDVAMDKYSGGVAKYRSSEGKLVLLPAKGPIELTVLDLLGGIRSTCTYIGASKMEEMNDESEERVGKMGTHLNELTVLLKLLHKRKMGSRKEH